MPRPLCARFLPMTVAMLVVGAIGGCHPIDGLGGNVSLPPASQDLTVKDEVVFPSLNGTVPLEMLAGLNSPRVVFRFEDRLLAGVIGHANGRLSVRKPLDAASQGEFFILDGDTPVARYAYSAKADVIEVQVSPNGFQAPFQLAPAEATAVSGERVVRVKPDSTLTLHLPGESKPLAQIQVDSTGRVSSASSQVVGGPATLRLDPMPVTLDLDKLPIAVRVVPFETKAASGTRIVQALPGVSNIQLLWNNNLPSIKDISLAADGAIRHPQGAVKAASKLIKPETVSWTFDSGASQLPWRLNRYETEFSAGSRTLTCLKADRQLTLALGRVDLVSPAFDAEGMLPPYLMRDGQRLVFRFQSVTIDPGELGIPFRIFPYEQQYQAGRRNVALLPGATAAMLSLAAQADSPGSFTLGQDGKLTTGSAGFEITDGMVKIRTIPIAINANTTRPFQIWPFEAQGRTGSRTVSIIPGSRAKVRTTVLDVDFSVDADGRITPHGPQLSGGIKSLTVSI